MANEPTKPTIPPPPLPEPYTIPAALLEQWGEIPPLERVAIPPLTRQDIDHLLTGLLRTIDTQVLLDRTIVEWSNGRLEEANQAINEVRRLNLDAQNSIRQFITAVMATVARERKRV
jgi:hypothetical protein